MSPDDVLRIATEVGLQSPTVRIRRSIAGDHVYASSWPSVEILGAVAGPSYYDIHWQHDGQENWFEVATDISASHLEVLLSAFVTGAKT